MRCGPVSMFIKLVGMWGNSLSLSEIATKVTNMLLIIFIKILYYIYFFLIYI